MRWATRSFHSTSRAWPSSSMQQADDGGAVLAGQREHPVEPGARRLAVLEVGRVEDGPAAEPLQAGLDAPAARWSRARAGRVAWVAKRRAISSMSTVPSRPT